MDNKFVTFLLIKRLQNLLLDDIDPKLKNLVSEAINKLALLQSSIRDAEHAAEWISKFLITVYSAEDAMDTFILRKGMQIRERQNGMEKMCCLQPIVRFHSQTQSLFINELKKFVTEVRQLGRIQGVSNTEDISVSSDLGSSSQNDQVQQQPWGRIFASHLEVIGLECGPVFLSNSVFNNFLTCLPNFWSLEGEGGSGKTTMARTLYNNIRYFNRGIQCAWIHVQEKSIVRNILVDILRQIDNKREKEPPLLEVHLKKRIAGILSRRHYLIVLDDVRTPDIFEAVRGALPESARGGTVIVTTRNAGVVPSSDMTQKVNTKRLIAEESWALFLKKVGVEDEKKIESSGLFTLKEKILKICDGLPLAIVMLGGLLSTKELRHQEWSRVIEQADQNGRDFKVLSYEDLPFGLKPCFLYLGLLPRAYEISVRRLLHLWVAERFVFMAPTSPKEMPPEDLAEVYLHELISRNMVEVVSWKSDGSPKTCLMPGLLHDFFSQKAADMGFFYIHQKSNSKSTPKFAIRRLASHSIAKNHPSSSPYIQHLHSYVSFDNQEYGSPAKEVGKFIEKLILKRDFGLLKVLDLEGVYKPRLPKTLGKLLNLSYLGLRSTALEFLPESIGDLPCLETLDVKHTHMKSFPTSILKAKSLQHLYMNGVCFNVSSIQMSPFGSLTQLRTLCGISVTRPVDVDVLNKLTGLKKLGLTCNSTSAEKAISLCISVELTMLQSLRLTSIDDESGQPSDISLNTLAKHQKLNEMYLIGRLQQITNDFFPPNLKVLTLSSSQLGEDPMPELGKLRHLNSLRLLGGSYTGKKINCPSGSFPKLHVLKMWKLQNLEEWSVEEGAMPCLEELEIRNCQNLKKAFGLKEVSSLKELILTNMAREFEYKIMKGRNIMSKINDGKSSSFLLRYCNLAQILSSTASHKLSNYQLILDGNKSFGPHSPSITTSQLMPSSTANED